MPLQIDRDKLLWIYRTMRLIRRFEEKYLELLNSGVPFGTGHLYIGQEAVATGLSAHLRDSDYIGSNHRGHGHCLAKGVDPMAMMAECYGRVTGTNRGRGGSMHITDARLGVLGVNPIIGQSMAHCVGAGMAINLRKGDDVAVSYLGDSAVGCGVFNESINLATIMNAPVIFVCENNQYAVTTPVEYAIAGKIIDRAAAYGIPGVKIDGMDVFAVYEAGGEAIERARGGGGPSFIEALTYRYEGHWIKDDHSKYRTMAEVDKFRDRDPIPAFRSRVLAEESLAAQDLDGVDAEIERLMDEMVEFAEASANPEAGELFEHVFAESTVGGRT